MYPLYGIHHLYKNELQELTSCAQTACNLKLIQSKAHLITGFESLFLLVQFVGRRLNCCLQQRNALPYTHDISATIVSNCKSYFDPTVEHSCWLCIECYAVTRVLQANVSCSGYRAKVVNHSAKTIRFSLVEVRFRRVFVLKLL